MRKPISILLAIAMLLSVLSVLTFTVSAEDEEEFTAVNLSLGYDIGMTYYTNIDYASNITAQVTINGRTDTIRAANSNGKASFSFNGIAPHELGATITAEVYKGDTATGVIQEKTVKDICALYLDNSLDGYSAETKEGTYKLVSNLLQYGEYARIYKNVPDSILTNITSENYVPDTLGTPTGDKTTGSGNENLSLRGLNVFFDTTNRYYVRFAATDISKVRFTVDSTAYTEFGEEGGYYFFYTNPMSAKDTNNVVSIKGYYNNEKAIEVNYSIEQYIIDLQSISASESMLNLAKSIYNYSNSANEYTQLDFSVESGPVIVIPVGFTGFLEGYFCRDGELATEEVDSGYEFIEGEFYKDDEKYTGFFENKYFEDGLKDNYEYEPIQISWDVVEIHCKGESGDGKKGGASQPDGKVSEKSGGNKNESPSDGDKGRMEKDGNEYTIPFDTTIKQFIEDHLYAGQTITWNKDGVRFITPDGKTNYVVGGNNNFALERGLKNNYILENKRKYTQVVIHKTVEYDNNPHLRLHIYEEPISNKDIVVYVEYLNKDALDIYKNIELVGKTLEEATEILLQIGIESEKINSNTDDVTFTTTGSNASSTQAAISSIAQNYLNNHGYSSVNVLDSFSMAAPVAPPDGCASGASTGTTIPHVNVYTPNAGWMTSGEYPSLMAIETSSGNPVDESECSIALVGYSYNAAVDYEDDDNYAYLGEGYYVYLPQRYILGFPEGLTLEEISENYVFYIADPYTYDMISRTVVFVKNNKVFVRSDVYAATTDGNNVIVQNCTPEPLVTIDTATGLFTQVEKDDIVENGQSYYILSQTTDNEVASGNLLIVEDLQNDVEYVFGDQTIYTALADQIQAITGRPTQYRGTHYCITGAENYNGYPIWETMENLGAIMFFSAYNDYVYVLSQSSYYEGVYWTAIAGVLNNTASSYGGIFKSILNIPVLGISYHNCSNVETVTIPDFIEYLYYSSLWGSVYVSSYPGFKNCSSLTSIEYCGVVYTSQSELKSALDLNGVHYKDDLFGNSGMPE